MSDIPDRQPRATLALIALLALVFARLVMVEGSTDIDVDTIVTFGGLVPPEWMGHDYWRLLSAGFLHFSAMHLVANGVCLLAWGTPLERMIGAPRLVLLFLVAIVAGNLVSLFSRNELFVGAGASGGTSGLLGALLIAWLARRIPVPASFFAINIGLNVALAVLMPGIDWQAHLGGFLAGMALMGPLLRRPG